MQMRTARVFRTAVAALAACLIGLAAGTPAAAADFDFLFSVSHVGNDDQYFLNFTVGSLGYPRAAIEPVLPRLRYVEADLPVVLFLARQSGRPPRAIVDLRAQGLSWSVIIGRVGLAPDILFAGIGRDPGPPYGKAWGHWKKRGRAVVLSDGDVAGLVQVQIAARYGGLPAFDLARGRGQGRPVAAALAEKKGRPYKDRPAHAGKPAKGRPDKPKGHKPH
jgi:hypothetical protein